MRKGVFILLLLLSLMGIAQAQDLSGVYRFVDGTTVNFPNDFLVFNENYDSVSLASSQSDIAISVVFARTIESQKLESLAQILAYHLAATPEVYTLGTEETIQIGEVEAIRFSRTVEGENPYPETYIVLPVGDNGSVAIARIQPNVEAGVFALSEEEAAMQIVESIHYENIRGELSTILGNTFRFGDGLLIEHRDIWTADEVTSTLTSEFATIRLTAFTPEELAALERKADPIEVLYYEVFQPSDESIVFNPEELVFENIRGREGVRYAIIDTVDGEPVQRVYFVSLMENGTVAALDIQTRVGFAILEDPDTADMIQTLRPEGTLPPVTMMALGSSFNLSSGATVRYPDYWRARSVEGAVSLDSLEVNMLIRSFSAEDAQDENYNDDLVDAILELTTPIDTNIALSTEDVSEITLENGRPAVQLSYTETEGGRSYLRRVMLILLDDESVVYVSISPQEGILELTAENDAEVRAILNTISPR
jgi:hypothetical protein